MRRWSEVEQSEARPARPGPSRVGLARIIVLLIGLVPLLLAACNVQQSPGAQLASDQTLTWPLQSESKIAYDEMLDPAEVSAAYDLATIDMLYVGLVRLGGDLSVQPDAATAMPDISPDGTRYTFHLRQGMKFSDGQPLTAKDFAFSLDRALDANLNGSCNADTSNPDPDDDAATYAPASVGTCSGVGATYLNRILGAGDRLNGKGGKDHSVVNPNNGTDDPHYGINILDDFTLVIRLDSPVSYFLEALTYPTSFAVEQSFVEKYPHGKWVDHLDQAGCSGPFMVKSYGDGTQMTMVPNPSWEAAWGQQISLKQVVRPLISTTDDEYSNYLKGQYDYTDVPANQYATAHGQGDFNELPQLATTYFGLNWHLAPFDNLSVRQAFALALNKQLLVDRVENGGAIPTNHIVPRGMPGYYPDLQLMPPLDKTQSLTGNQAAAQQLISDARKNCPAFIFSSDKAHQYCKYIAATNPAEIDMYTRNTDTAKQLATTASQQWNSVLGVNIKVVPVKFGTLLHMVIFEPDPLKRPQIWGLGWLADYADPQDWLSLQFATGAPYNASGVSDPTLDSMLQKADTDPVANTTQIQTRLADYNKAEQYIIDQVAWIPYQQAKFSWRERPWVHAFALNSQDFVPDVAWANVTILDH
jgi:peptide/nickel transport system substrate-binding protein/oligopeptide transport system substrate-binding protein